MNTLTTAERAAGWQLLFDGKSTSEWRGFRQETTPAGWQVAEGLLTRAASGGDIITIEQFTDFELKLEWKVAEGGNSGIMFRVTEDQRRTWHSGPELPVLDDARHPDGRVPETSAGSNYGLHAPKPGAVRPAGSWNEVRLLVQGTHVEHWLNGVRVLEFELGTPELEALLAASKYRTIQGFAERRKGHIVLQDHGDDVWFRNIKLRELPPQ